MYSKYYLFLFEKFFLLYWCISIDQNVGDFVVFIMVSCLCFLFFLEIYGIKIINSDDLVFEGKFEVMSDKF